MLITKWGGLLKVSRSKIRKTRQRVKAPHHSLPHHSLPVSKFTHELWCKRCLDFRFFLRIYLRKFQRPISDQLTECFHLETTFSMSFKGEKRPQTDSFGRLSVLNSKRTQLATSNKYIRMAKKNSNKGMYGLIQECILYG